MIDRAWSGPGLARARWTALAAVATAVAAGGCYDSLVSGACAPGMIETGGACVAAPVDARGAGPDGGSVAPDDARPGPDAGGAVDAALADAAVDDAAVDAAALPDAMPAPDAASAVDAASAADATPAPDAFSCGAGLLECSGACIDPLTDPDSCGACGHVCASGLCGGGACLGDIAGHVVLVGHDYQTRHAAAVRVLGNALALGAGAPIRVGVWRGSASPTHTAAALAALSDAAASVGRTWQRVDLADLPAEPDVDVVVLLPQDGDAASATAAGQAWSASGRAFVTAGGVVVALGGEGTTTHLVLAGAGLLDATASAPATGASLDVVGPGDALAIGVTTPYHADTSTLAYQVASGMVVVATPSGDAVVVDSTALDPGQN